MTDHVDTPIPYANDRINRARSERDQLIIDRDTYKALWEKETEALDRQIVASTAAINALKAENAALRRDRVSAHHDQSSSVDLEQMVREKMGTQKDQ